MQTVRELRRTIEDLSDNLSAQYGRHTPPCEILHGEFGFGMTARDDAESVQAQAKEQGIVIEDESVKLTVEHDDLHEALRRIVLDSMSQSQGADQLAAAMLVVGRRIGLREAAELMGE